MKKILFVLLGLALFCSCNNEGTIYATDIHGGIKGEIIVKEVIYKGHSYLEFKDCGIYGQGWVHNPDCECFKDKE